VIDLVMFGLKTWDPGRIAISRVEMMPTLEFAAPRCQRRPAWIRFVLVPGLTDDPDDIAQIAGFAAGLGNIERVEVLPFHQMGRFKWKQLGIRYALDEAEPPTPEAVERACAIFHKAGLKAY
jgi:pyruvate formate lyase activating enzyme